MERVVSPARYLVDPAGEGGIVGVEKPLSEYVSGCFGLMSVCLVI
jgi:hypothetical protein